MRTILENNCIHKCTKPSINVRILQHASGFSSVLIEYSELKIEIIWTITFNAWFQLILCIFEFNSNDFL